MNQYMLLLYENEAAYANVAPEQWGKIKEAHGRFARQATELGGKIVSGAAFQSSSAANSIRADGTTVGPFFKTKEALCGYYLIEAKDAVQASAIAQLCPAPHGGVEVRPILEIPG